MASGARTQPERRRRWRQLLMLLILGIFASGALAFIPGVPTAAMRRASRAAPAARPSGPVASPLFSASTALSDDGGGAVKPPKPKLQLKGLRSERFRHPLDQQATEQLRRLPGLEWIVRRFMSVVEEAVYLDNISSALLVGPNQMPALYESLLEACRILDLQTVPELYVRQNPVPNAYCMAIQGRRPFIVVHTCLLDLLTPAELQCVIAHELGHIKCEHGVYITAANGLALGLYSVGGSIGRMLGERIQGLLFAWLRAAEFSCDRAALLVAQDLNTVSSTLLKLVGGSQSQAGQLSVEAFLNQARSYDAAAGTPVGRLLRNQMEPSLTHPLPVIRVRELDRWCRSQGYMSIMSRGVAMDEETGKEQAAAVASVSAGSGSGSGTGAAAAAPSAE